MFDPCLSPSLYVDRNTFAINGNWARGSFIDKSLQGGRLSYLTMQQPFKVHFF